ncbi:hypothetical protein ABIA39_003242 [Nocardia sp. GAS34]|uniref:hypothetical protein n=1 Tax=unclassified Nocardia TaxID=2637762 RepID=UPI003D1C2442
MKGYRPTIKQPNYPSSPTKPLPLLEPAHLFQAIAGRSSCISPLAEWARELADMHAELIPFKLEDTLRQRNPAEEQIRAAIDHAVNEIDAWTARNIPRTKGARHHTHTLGEVISRIAKMYTEAWWTVLHSADGETRHRAWFHLSEAREGYADMVNEIRWGHLQLPLGWPGIRRDSNKAGQVSEFKRSRQGVKNASESQRISAS